MVWSTHQLGAFLEGKQRDDFSQFGEDGLLEALFEKIGTTNRWCFEVGAADGLFYSNTKRLRDQGWRAVLVEGNDVKFGQLNANYGTSAICVHAHIVPDSMDDILDSAGAPADLDLGVIDIDGQDWWIWSGLQRYRPRVLMIEHCNREWDAPIPPLGDGSGKQAGLAYCILLAATKGYTPLVMTDVNLICCDKAIVEKCLK